MFHFRVYNLSSGKIEVDSKFPTHIGAFMGLNPGANIAFHTTGESEFVSILMDGNQAIYPLTKDSTPTQDSIKDPQLLDLPPVQALGIGKFDIFKYFFRNAKVIERQVLPKIYLQKKNQHLFSVC